MLSFVMPLAMVSLKRLKRRTTTRGKTPARPSMAAVIVLVLGSIVNDASRWKVRTNASDCEDGEQVLAESSEHGEMLVIDVGRSRDQSLVVDDTVGKLGAYDVGMGCKLLECRRCDVQVVCDTGVMVCE